MRQKEPPKYKLLTENGISTNRTQLTDPDVMQRLIQMGAVKMT